MRPTPQAMPERSSVALEPQVARYPRHTVPEASQSSPASQELKPRGYPRPTSQSELDRELTESRSIRAGTPSLLIPLPLGTSLPSWARTEAGLSPSQKKLAHSAATRLQRAFRKWWFRNFSSSGPMGFQALRDAVIYLQRWWRLAHARKLRRLHLRRCWKRMSFQILVLQDAASYVQRGWHMVKVRAIVVCCPAGSTSDPACLAPPSPPSPKRKAEIWNGKTVFLASQMCGQKKADFRHLEVLAGATSRGCVCPEPVERSSDTSNVCRVEGKA